MIDVVTVCAGDDLMNIESCISSINANLSVNKVYVITNDIDRVPICHNVVAVDENEIISHDKVSLLRKIDFPFCETRFGWYFQQFLKMSFARSVYCKGDYLIWDADTILLKRIDFFDNDVAFFTKGEEELNTFYVNTYQKLLGIDVAFSFSLISQHLYVNRKVMVMMLNEIERRYEKGDFCQAILNTIEGSSRSLFSEYETYTNYYASLGMPYQIIERRWFRHAASLCKFGSDIVSINKYFYDCDYVAMEKFDLTLKGKFKGIIKYLKYRLSKPAESN
jgi:hypothetical protein